MKRWKQWVLLACLVSMIGHQVSANAVLAPVENYVVNRAVGGIIANRIAAAQGVAANDAVWLAKAANDPVYKATMAGISSQMTAVNVASTVAGGALALAGAPLWLTIAAGLGITALGAYYFSSDGLQKVTISQVSSSVSIQAQSTPVKPAYTAPAVPPAQEPSYGQLALTAGLIVYKGLCDYGGDCLSFPAAPAGYRANAPFLSEGGDYITIAYSLAEIRGCLVNAYRNLASVILSMATRTKFSAVAVNTSTSFASRRKLPSQENVLSTTHRFGSTAKPSLILVEMWHCRFNTSCTNLNVVPRYPASAEKARSVGHFSTARTSKDGAPLVSCTLAA